MKRQVISILELSREPVLAGRDEGEAMRGRLMQRLDAQAGAILFVLDFAGITVATASYLDEITLKLRPVLRKRTAFPFIANLAKRVAEEFESLLTRANESFLVGETDAAGAVVDARILGVLESKLRETYDLVKSKNEAGATELHEEFVSTDKVGPTAWNNRLNTLADKGFLQEIPIGRAKKYRPLMETR
jgi:hypothetical protein